MLKPLLKLLPIWISPVAQARSSNLYSTAYPIATDDRCANFLASTCPAQPLNLQQTLSASKLPLKKFHRLLDLAFWAGGISKISKAAKVLSLTHTRSSPHITFSASLRAFFLAKNSLSSSPDKLSERCPEVITGGADGGNRPSRSEER